MPKTAAPRASRVRLLVEERLDTDLERHVMTARGTDERAATSWSALAYDIQARTGIAVTAETLRIWFHAPEAKRLERARARRRRKPAA